MWHDFPDNLKNNIAHFHLPGLFEFYEFYRVFLPLYREHPEYFYDWCDIASVYGAPADCLWGGGRVGFGNDNPRQVFSLMRDYGISCRLTLSNSLLREEHLSDVKCNKLCDMLCDSDVCNGVIVHSDLLLDYLSSKYPQFYFVSSTTKVLTDFADFKSELARDAFKFVVPDFRHNKSFSQLDALPDELKAKVEFLCNECCDFWCSNRKRCYENVSRLSLGEEGFELGCTSPSAIDGYVFSKAMENPGFISVEDIVNTYLPIGFSNFKIEGRSLGSALLLEFILYYMTKPECHLKVREKLYLNHSLDLF